MDEHSQRCRPLKGDDGGAESGGGGGSEACRREGGGEVTHDANDKHGKHAVRQHVHVVPADQAHSGGVGGGRFVDTGRQGTQKGWRISSFLKPNSG